MEVEFPSELLKEYRAREGIIHEYLTLYTPRQKGMAKTRNRPVMDMVRSMFSHTRLLIYLWGRSIEHGTIYYKQSTLQEHAQDPS